MFNTRSRGQPHERCHRTRTHLLHEPPAVNFHRLLAAPQIRSDLVSAALARAGVVRVPSWQVAHRLADGRLRIVLEAYQRPPTPLSILTLRTRLLLPKVRAP